MLLSLVAQARGYTRSAKQIIKQTRHCYRDNFPMLEICHPDGTQCDIKLLWPHEEYMYFQGALVCLQVMITAMDRVLPSLPCIRRKSWWLHFDKEGKILHPQTTTLPHIIVYCFAAAIQLPWWIIIMYLCMYVCACVCINVYKYVCMNTGMYECTYVYTWN